MASRHGRCCAALLLAAAALGAEEKKVSPYAFVEGTPTLVGRGGHRRHFWMPQAFAFGKNQTLVRVKVTDEKDCGCDDGAAAQVRTEACFQPCSGVGFVDYISTDGGVSFTPADGRTDKFCGGTSFQRGNERVCAEVDADGALTATTWSISTDGKANAVVKGALEIPANTSDVVFGPAATTATTAKTVWLVTENGKPVIYRSDDGANFTRAGKLPFDGITPAALREASIVSKKDDTLVVALRRPAGDVVTTQSRTLGKMWAAPEKLATDRYVPQLAATYYTTLTAGSQYAPHISYVRDAQKKTTRTALQLSEHHDIYSVDFLEAGDALAGCADAPYDKFCESTGRVTLAPLDGLSAFGVVTNTTMYLACYDKLANGWTGPALPTKDAQLEALGETGDEVYCARLRVSDEEPVAKVMEKLAANEERKKRLEKEEEERKEREEKQKKEREERAKAREEMWARIDAMYLEEARKYEAEDGELIIVREYSAEFKEYFE